MTLQDSSSQDEPPLSSDLEGIPSPTLSFTPHPHSSLPIAPHVIPHQQYSDSIGYYGLTPLTSARPTLATSDTTTIASPSSSRPAGVEPSRSRAATQAKRPSADHAEAQRAKKPRTRVPPPRSIDLSPFTKPALPHKLLEPPLTSPLFFSHTPQRPGMARPPSFIGLQAAGEMIKSVRDGDGVTTLQLARGTVNSASPARSATPSSWASIDPSNSGRTPDTQGSTPGPIASLQSIGFLELLERDDRPTFVIDGTQPASSATGPFSIMYMNPALNASPSIRNLISGDFRDEDEITKSVYQGFQMWVRNAGNNTDGLDVFLPSQHYGGLSWTCSILRNRFRVVSANTSAASVAGTSPEPLLEREPSLEPRARALTPIAQPKTPSDIDIPDRDYFGPVAGVHLDDQIPPEMDSMVAEEHILVGSNVLTPETALHSTPQPSFDWTRIPLTSDLPDHIRFIRNMDWASTPLGAIEDWSSDLRAMANMVMGSPHPAALYWGPELTTIYNEAYIAMAGAKHPRLMGSSYKDAWAEIWPELEPIFTGAWESGQATMKNDDRLIMNRHGFPEETFFSWSIVPLVGSDGSVVGLYNPAFENTRRKVAERRMLTLHNVGEKTSLAQDVKGFWKQVNQGLEGNEEDIPFSLVYSVADDSETDSSSMHSGSLVHPPHLQLEAALGVPTGHHCLIHHLDLRTSNEGFAPYMRQSMSQSGAPVKLSSEDGTMPEGLMQNLLGRGCSEPCRSIVIFPVHPTTGGDSVAGFIVMGVNPRRPFDDDYQLFIKLLSRQLATSLASVVLFEEEIRRGQKAARLAAMDKQSLTQQLQDRTREVEESELKFTRMAEFAPVGMFIADSTGYITYCNDMWWEISRHPKTLSVTTWMDGVEDEDRPALEVVWRQLIGDRVAITQEFRFKRFPDGSGPSGDTWVLMSAYPEKDPGTGMIKSIFGCITNITQQKRAEQIQVERREEAVVLKRQQENFIDITSHEMRNPLSAILQCADEIAETLSGLSRACGNANEEYKAFQSALDACSEAANTITLCASHQKRIVDDILTLSKLDSQLLLVTPVDVQPTAVVQRVLKMFEGELNTNDIQLEFKVKNRYLDMGVDWVKLDPSRLLQVLINLMTNAIKFTQSRPKRMIQVTLDATMGSSEATDIGMDYFPSDRPDKDDITNDADWGQGEKLNLHFSVMDTGRGLDEHERKLLFQRFSQATPRTHVQYGGSGLGLFISRTLTELQGGQIGAVSTKGEGSTFSFYVQSRKTGPPPPETVPGPAAPPLVRAPGSSTIIENKQPRPSGIDLFNKALNNTPAKNAVRSHTAVDGKGQRLFDVLIVEDNLVNQKVLQRQLSNIGNTTKVANHGGEALEKLKASRFWQGRQTSGEDISVILMDLEMPIMDGMTCARKIRELERQGTIVAHIPIIAVTAYARPEQIKDAKDAGIDDVISKPFRMPDLIPKIEELVDRYAAYAGPAAA